MPFPSVDELDMITIVIKLKRLSGRTDDPGNWVSAHVEWETTDKQEKGQHMLNAKTEEGVLEEVVNLLHISKDDVQWHYERSGS